MSAPPTCPEATVATTALGPVEFHLTADDGSVTPAPGELDFSECLDRALDRVSAADAIHAEFVACEMEIWE